MKSPDDVIRGVVNQRKGEKGELGEKMTGVEKKRSGKLKQEEVKIKCPRITW